MNQPTPVFTADDLETLVVQRRSWAREQNEKRKAVRIRGARFFLERGLGAKPEEFLRDSGITEKQFSEFFSSTDDLIGTAICASKARLEEAFRVLINDTTADRMQSLRAAVTIMFEAMSRTHDCPAGLGSEVLAYYPDDNPLHETAVACKRLLFPLLEELCGQAQINDPVTAAGQLLLLAEGSFLLRHILGDEKSFQLGINAAERLIVALPKRKDSTSG